MKKFESLKKLQNSTVKGLVVNIGSSIDEWAHNTIACTAFGATAGAIGGTALVAINFITSGALAESGIFICNFDSMPHLFASCILPITSIYFCLGGIADLQNAKEKLTSRPKKPKEKDKEI